MLVSFGPVKLVEQGCVVATPTCSWHDRTYKL